jgi:hypothetical protein
MSWFRKKKNVIPYIPQGRVGYRRVSNEYPFCFTIVVEEIGKIGIRSKIRILEVDIDKDCIKTKEQCLLKWGLGDWVPTDYINWETDCQRADRLGIPIEYEVKVDDLEEETLYRTITPHNFID